MGKKEIGFKGQIEKSKAVAYLEKVLEGLKAGTWYVQHGDEYVTLQPANTVYLEVSAAQKKGKEKFMLEMSWYKDMPEEMETDLTITTTKPEIKEPDSTQEPAMQ